MNGGAKPAPGSREARLAGVVRGEALRADAESRIRPDPARVADGWEWRFVLEHGRAADLVRLYEQAGFDVATDPVQAEQIDEECTDCRLVSALRFVALYTRPRSSRA